MERRKNARVKFHVTATVRCGGIDFEQLVIRDLSLTGVYLRGLTGCGVGDRCEVSLFLSGTDNELKLSMQGEVVRIEKDGASVRFDGLDIDTFLHLKKIVYFNADDPDKLEEILIEMPPEGQFVD